jgi:hypothetical protein
MKHIDKFDDYYSIKNIMGRVVEGLNSPLEVIWDKTPNEWHGTFEIDDTKYIIEIINFSDCGHWLFKFRAEDTGFDLTNDIKKAFSVLPTIEKACIDFLTEISPEVFVFCASDKSSGRKKLYTVFSHKIRDDFNMIYHTEHKNDPVSYTHLRAHETG